MFESIKKIKEYSKLGHSMNSVSILLKDIIEQYQITGGNLNEEIYFVAYVARKGIIDRLEEYEWNMEGPILVSSISSKNITLFYAYSKTILQIKSLSVELNLSYEVESILAKKEGFYEFEQMLPDSILKTIDKLIH
ncbi:MAG: hypothetical protein RIQ59_1489 [Bacteroidota bacterium]|jgi:hypothetical protein